VLREIEERLASDASRLERRVLVFAGHGWSAGIVGLAAGKLVERYQRPAVVLSIEDGEARGSARSVPGFDLAATLANLEGLLHRHGGHERAAGLTVAVENLLDLEDALDAAFAASAAEPPGPRAFRIDADLPAERMRLDVARMIQVLAPFGEGNPVPLLRATHLPIRGYSTMGSESQHLKIHTAGPAGFVDAILWHGGGRSRELVGARAVDVVGSLEINAWNSSVRPQVNVADFRRSTA
jgi:single-stranded-DNA-specific exonuclease